MIVHFFLRLLTRETLDIFRHRVESKNWDGILSMDSANEAYDWFIDKLYKECCKLRTISPHKKSRKPWITRNILKMIRKKNKLYDRFLSTKDLDMRLKRLKSVEMR